MPLSRAPRTNVRVNSGTPPVPLVRGRGEDWAMTHASTPSETSDVENAQENQTVAPSTTSSDSATLYPAARAMNVTKSYGSAETSVRALDDVSVDFHSGQFTAIM